MTAYRWLWVIAVLVAAAGCEKDEKHIVDVDSDGVADSDTGSQSGDGGQDAYTAQTTTKPEDIPDMPAVPVCLKACSTQQDCAEPGKPLRQAGNFSCQNGVCLYLGCRDDANCDEAYPSMGYKCSPKGECVRPCTSPEDCVIMDLMPGIDDDGDANNFACENGMCKSLGCRSSEECEASLGPSGVCWDTYATHTPQCGYGCDDEKQDVSNCVKSRPVDNGDKALAAAYDEDNYSCLAGTCVYLGCANDAECGDGYRCVKIDQ